MIFRHLRADEIECRIGSVGARGFTLLLYKDARCDMNILDEMFGEFGWKRWHEVNKNTLFCFVAIKNPKTGEWVEKSDAGTESYTEKEKGEASDSFKRACVNWGIGRELYTAPLIFIRAKTEPQGSGFRLANKSDGYGFKVAQIEYKDGKIAHLILTKDGNTVFNWQMDPYIEENPVISETEVQMVLTMAEDAKCKSVLHDMGFTTTGDVKKMTRMQYSEFARRCSE